jgi:3-hydroxyacyl-[acyl-carrier-protein] dehydratase
MTEVAKVSVALKSVWEGVFHFDHDDGIYRDHFPGYPVVPGSVVIQAFLTAGMEANREADSKASSKADISGEGFTIENFRFREFLLPGRYPYRIERKENALHCTISRDDKKLVTGVLKR